MLWDHFLHDLDGLGRDMKKIFIPEQLLEKNKKSLTENMIQHQTRCQIHLYLKVFKYFFKVFVFDL